MVLFDFPEGFIVLDTANRTSTYTSAAVVASLNAITSEPIQQMSVLPENLAALHETFVNKLKYVFEVQHEPWTGDVNFGGTHGYPTPFVSIQWNVNDPISFF